MNDQSWTSDPRDLLDRDQVLMQWQVAKDAIEKAKAAEMEWREYVVKRAFPQKQEGTNTLELGNGYELKAVVKFNYNLADNQTVDKVLDDISKIGNEGTFIAERLVSWKPSFLLTEYRALQASAESGSAIAQQILAKIGEMLTVTDAAPTVSIKEPKRKK